MKRSHRKVGSSGANLKKSRTGDNLNGKPIWRGFTFYVLPLKFGPVRQKLLENQIIKHSGSLFKDADNFDCIQYCIVEETITFDYLFENNYCTQFENASFIKCSWISHCVKADEVLPIHGYAILENTFLKLKISERIKSIKDEGESSGLGRTDDKESCKEFVSNPSEGSKVQEIEQSKESIKKFVV